MTRGLLSALLCAACLPDFHALEGRPCNAEHGCIYDELTCVSGFCTADAGTTPGKNLLANGGFEKNLQSWDLLDNARATTDGGRVHSGMRAAHVVMPTTGAAADQPGVSQNLNEPVADGALVCWDGWVDRGSVSAAVEVTLKYKYTDGTGTQFPNFSARSSLAGGTWEHLEKSITPQTGSTLTGFLVRASFQSDAAFWVDDLRLWFGNGRDGGCGDGP